MQSPAASQGRAWRTLACVALLSCVAALAVAHAVRLYAGDAAREARRAEQLAAPSRPVRPAPDSPGVAARRGPRELDLDTIRSAEGFVAEYGEGAEAVVVAVVPAGGCHGGAVSLLRRAAARHPDRVRVLELRVGSPAAGLAGAGCAEYLVNGSSVCVRPDGDAGEAVAIFEGKPGELWTVHELGRALSLALGADLGVESNAA